MCISEIIGVAICVGMTAITGTVEGGTLAGAKLLAKHHNTASKVAKYILGALALVAAVAFTCGTGFTATVIVALNIDTSCLVIPIIVGSLAAMLTLPGHIYALKWSKLY